MQIYICNYVFFRSDAHMCVMYRLGDILIINQQDHLTDVPVPPINFFLLGFPKTITTLFPSCCLRGNTKYSLNVSSLAEKAAETASQSSSSPPSSVCVCFVVIIQFSGQLFNLMDLNWCN